MRRRPLTRSLPVLVLVGCTCAGAEDRPPRRLDEETGTPPSAETALPRPTGDTGQALAWVMLDTGHNISCGVLTDGRLACWGDDDLVAAAPPGPFVAVSLGNNDTACGLEPGGTVSCWCVDLDYERVCTDAPRGDGFVEVQNATFWACAEDATGELVCWGDRSLASGAPTEPVLDWSIETDLGCAVLLDGSVTCWGDTGRFADAYPPPAIEPPPELKYTQVAAGRGHGCAVDTDQSVHCWGRTGMLAPYPEAPAGPFVSITAWSQATCGFRADSTVECWYDFPQLWDVDDEPPEADGGPRWEPPPGNRWAQIGLGEWDACGLTLDGEAHCWMPQGDTRGEVLELPSLADLQ